MNPARYGQVRTARPRRITIQYDDAPQSVTDGSVDLFTNAKTLFQATTIDWTTLGGTTQLMADQPRGENAAVIRIRWRKDKTPTPAHRILYVANGVEHYFDIINVTDVGNQHQFWDLQVREKGI